MDFSIFAMVFHCFDLFSTIFHGFLMILRVFYRFFHGFFAIAVCCWLFSLQLHLSCRLFNQTPGLETAGANGPCWGAGAFGFWESQNSRDVLSSMVCI